MCASRQSDTLDTDTLGGMACHFRHQILRNCDHEKLQICCRHRNGSHNDYAGGLCGTRVTGVVTLSGTVQSRPEADRVVEMTKTVQGVREIRNNLDIRP
jgi:hypothetical protein